MESFEKMFDRWLMGGDRSWNPFTRYMTQMAQEFPQVDLPQGFRERKTRKEEDIGTTPDDYIDMSGASDHDGEGR